MVAAGSAHSTQYVPETLSQKTVVVQELCSLCSMVMGILLKTDNPVSTSDEWVQKPIEREVQQLEQYG